MKPVYLDALAFDFAMQLCETLSIEDGSALH